MGHDTSIFDIKGFIFSHPDEKELSLDIALAEPSWEKEVQPDDLQWLRDVLAKIKALPFGKNVCVLPACSVTGSGPFAIGWMSNQKKIKSNDLKALSKVMTDSGFKVVERIEGDRFASYG